MAARKQVIPMQAVEVNISPDAFRRYAGEYFSCAADFIAKNGFSPVPYFLMSRAIELALKARHLESKRQSEVKRAFGHDLVKAYAALDQSERHLTQHEESILKSASDIYAGKGFEYIKPIEFLTAFSRYPDLEELRKVALKLLNT